MAKKSNRVVESIAARVDVENINQNELDKKVIKLAKSLVKGETIEEDDFRLLKIRITSPTYKMVDKGDKYALQRGEEVLHTWVKKSEAERLDNEAVVESECPNCDKEKMIPDSEDLEEEVEADFKALGNKAKAEFSKGFVDQVESNLDESHTDDIIAEILELASAQGKNWTEEALRKLKISQLHVIKSKLLDPSYKTKKEKQAEEEREARKAQKAELVKTESEGVITYKIRIDEDEEILDVDSDEEAIAKFEDRFSDEDELNLKSTGVSGLKSSLVDGFKVYVKELSDGKFAYIVRDPKSSVTLTSGTGETEEECLEFLKKDLEEINNGGEDNE